jgi:hypothetical protein
MRYWYYVGAVAASTWERERCQGFSISNMCKARDRELSKSKPKYEMCSHISTKAASRLTTSIFPELRNGTRAPDRLGINFPNPPHVIDPYLQERVEYLICY